MLFSPHFVGLHLHLVDSFLVMQCYYGCGVLGKKVLRTHTHTLTPLLSVFLHRFHGAVRYCPSRSSSPSRKRRDFFKLPFFALYFSCFALWRLTCRSVTRSCKGDQKTGGEVDEGCSNMPYPRLSLQAPPPPPSTTLFLSFLHYSALLSFLASVCVAGLQTQHCVRVCVSGGLHLSTSPSVPTALPHTPHPSVTLPPAGRRAPRRYFDENLIVPNCSRRFCHFLRITIVWPFHLS